MALSAVSAQARQDTKPVTKKAEAAKKAPAAKKAAAVARIAPTHANVPYSPIGHERQVLDFYASPAAGDAPAPLVVYIHGGGWMNGDKSGVSPGLLKPLLDAGIHVASINYRFIPQAEEAKIEPPVKGPVSDAARAIQFLRSKAADWKIDPTRIGATGGSAGACSSLWVGFHDDMADPKSDDPVARQSTRLTCIAVNGPQTALDPKQLREWMPNMAYGGHAFGFRKNGQQRPEEFQAFYEGRDKVLPWIKEYSPYELVTSDDPPVFMEFPKQDKPAVAGEKQTDPTHSAVLGVKLQEKMKAAGLESRVSYPGHADPEFANSTAFLIARLKPAK
jgi:acetyl esterase/lipase